MDGMFILIHDYWAIVWFTQIVKLMWILVN
jgi:hypothetical protein